SAGDQFAKQRRLAAPAGCHDEETPRLTAARHRLDPRQDFALTAGQGRNWRLVDRVRLRPRRTRLQPNQFLLAQERPPAAPERTLRRLVGQ
ncbi:hypothetical protein RZS08_02920, partial [Arthrospira platensis SPKY1]|nr:hypothetical protein [Arthrospira platensis SPKY1]